MIAKQILHALKSLADLLAPRECVVCGNILAPEEKHLCLYCLNDIPYTRFEGRTHNPMADKFNSKIEEGRSSANRESSAREPYAYATALFFYSHNAGFRHIPYQIKYHGNLRIGSFFGRALGERIASSPHFQDIDAIIPVPLHWARRLKRGYNQAEILAVEIAQAIGKPLRTDILTRNRRTVTQTKLSVEAKTRNVAGAFSVRPGIKTTDLSHILLVDDVFTTGSTLMACFTALRTVFPPDVRISVATLGFVGEG